MLILVVVKDVPVPRLDPPDDAAYQFKIPALADAVNVKVPALQRDCPDPVGAANVRRPVRLTLSTW